MIKINLCTINNSHWINDGVIVMPPPLGAGGIMFSGCPAGRPAGCLKPEIPFFDLYMGPLVHPTNRNRFTACPSVRPSVRPDAQNGVLWLLLSINLGAFFLCGYWVLCGCVCMSRPTNRCLVATFVHKFGCLFSCVAIGFVWLQINKIATKVPTVPKNSHRSGVL